MDPTHTQPPAHQPTQPPHLPPFIYSPAHPPNPNSNHHGPFPFTALPQSLAATYNVNTSTGCHANTTALAEKRLFFGSKQTEKMPTDKSNTDMACLQHSSGDLAKLCRRSTGRGEAKNIPCQLWKNIPGYIYTLHDELGLVCACLCACLCMSVCVLVCVFVCVCVHACVCLHTCVRVRVCAFHTKLLVLKLVIQEGLLPLNRLCMVYSWCRTQQCWHWDQPVTLPLSIIPPAGGTRMPILKTAGSFKAQSQRR